LLKFVNLLYNKNIEYINIYLDTNKIKNINYKMNKPYSFSKSIKDKEQKLLNYYKKISTIELPKITIIPKKKKVTKKNMSRDGLKEDRKEDSKDNTIVENHIKSEKDEKDEKKLTKKIIVIIDY